MTQKLVSKKELKSIFGVPYSFAHIARLGSGTTLIAAETTGRVCLAMEIDPLYVDVAIRRWQTFTGKAATLKADGQSFEEVAGERLTKEPEEA
jgi:hypothetical protein